jgi:hypothetical protein
MELKRIFSILITLSQLTFAEALRRVALRGAKTHFSWAEAFEYVIQLNRSRHQKSNCNRENLLTIP